MGYIILKYRMLLEAFSVPFEALIMSFNCKDLNYSYNDLSNNNDFLYTFQMLRIKPITQNAIRKVHYAIIVYIISAFAVLNYSSADIVKPALVEISVFTEGHYRVEVRASVEAMMTGINSQYKTTQSSPFAEAYDELRVLQSAQLKAKFLPFQQTVTEQIRLHFDDQPIDLHITEVNIPVPGYTKVPRISTIVFEGNIDRQVKQLNWYYPARFSDNAVRVRQVDSESDKWHWSKWQWIRDDSVSNNFSLSAVFTDPPLLDVISEYILTGFDHIIPKGLDHILFILGIFLLSTKLKPLAWQATMFTVAHSITLSLSMFNVISLPASIVEPLIALSIAYIGLENLFAHKLNNSRLVLVFAFGLLHGLGFASVLADFGMPESRYAIALIGFNIGVELAQLAILLVAYFSITIWFKSKEKFHNYITIPGSIAIGIIGLYWTWDRLSWPMI